MARKKHNKTEAEINLENIFAERLRQLIPYRKVTEIAQRAGVAPESVHRWLAGRGGSPRLSTVQRLADALGVSIFMMITAPEDHPPQKGKSIFDHLHRAVDEAESRAANNPAPQVDADNRHKVREIMRDVSSYLDYRIAKLHSDLSD